MSALPRALVPVALSMCLLASARGQDWTESTTGNGPVDDLGALLREVARALERTPEAPATVRIRAFR